MLLISSEYTLVETIMDNRNLSDCQLLIHESIELFDAAEKGDLFRLNLALDNGTSPDAQGPKGWTALRVAAVHGRTHAVMELLRRGAVADAANLTGQTALIMAAVHGRTDIASLLLFYGADPNRANISGHTPLMAAAQHGHAGIAGLLIEKGSDVDARCVEGETALMLAVYYGHEEIVRLLLDAGADTRAVYSRRMSQEKTLVEIAESRDYWRIRELLLGSQNGHSQRSVSPDYRRKKHTQGDSALRTMRERSLV
jgi:ankyrin repeat protein